MCDITPTSITEALTELHMKVRSTQSRAGFKISERNSNRAGLFQSWLARFKAIKMALKWSKFANWSVTQYNMLNVQAAIMNLLVCLNTRIFLTCAHNVQPHMVVSIVWCS